MPPLEMVDIDTSGIVDDHARLVVGLAQAGPVALREGIDMRDPMPARRGDLPLGDAAGRARHPLGLECPREGHSERQQLECTATHQVAHIRGQRSHWA